MSRYRRDLFPVSIFHGAVQNNQQLKTLLIERINRTKDLDDAEPPSGWTTDNLKTSFSSERINKFVFGDDNDELKGDIVQQYLVRSVVLDLTILPMLFTYSSIGLCHESTIVQLADVSTVILD